MAGGEQDGKMVARPKFQWEWNLNTIVVLVGFGTGVFAWGGTWQSMVSRQEVASQNYAQLASELREVKSDMRRVDNLDYRVGAIEKRESDAARTLQEMQKSINSLASDMRVTREILERLEAEQRRDDNPR